MSIQKINSNTLADGAALNSIASSVNFRNRIINGDMRIDQRNAGLSASLSTSLAYFLDRWNAIKQTGSAGTVQQSSIAPSTFTNSLLATNNATGASPSAAQLSRLQHRIEGFNAADLDYGTASAKTTTLSFWVRSSVVGTYGVGLSNSSFDRSYVATYNIDSADTFEYKTITIPGDTTGTWLKTNGMGIALSFDLGSGTDANGTADAWQTGFKVRTSGCVNWVATGSATFRITGVQLEAGSVATPFERRPYGTELALCTYYAQAVSPGASRANNFDNAFNIGEFRFGFSRMRATPTITTTGNFVGTPNNNTGPYYSFAVVSAQASSPISGTVNAGYSNGKTLDTAGVAWNFPSIFLSAEL
jgi:hypothetical protein